MNGLYSRVNSIAKQVLYPYIIDNEIPLLKYHYNYFLQYIIRKNNIRVISHHFSNLKIEGLTLVDHLGISFSYERDSPKTKRNFTLCHELGHFILKHNRNFFLD